MKAVNSFLTLMISLYSSAVFCKMIELKDADFKKLNEKLALHLELEPLEKATGYFSVDSDRLHGKFDLGEEYTGHDLDNNAFYLYKNKVSGNYHQGKKEGEWIYSYVFDNGLELFERHNIVIQYNHGKCVESQFKGVIGHIMPITNHTFTNSELCTPISIRDKAWQLWSEQYNSSSS